MFVDILIGYIGSPNCVHYLSIQYLLIAEDIVQSLLNLCVFMMFALFDLHRIAYQSNIGLVAKVDKKFFETAKQLKTPRFLICFVCFT